MKAFLREKILEFAVYILSKPVVIRWLLTVKKQFSFWHFYAILVRIIVFAATEGEEKDAEMVLFRNLELR